MSFFSSFLSSSYRNALGLFEFKAHWRAFTLRRRYDAVFISNLRDKRDRRITLGNKKIPSGHFAGPGIYFKHLIGKIRLLDVTTQDILTASGRNRAQEAFIRAVEWAEQQGTRVILLAAITKRLFGEFGYELKTRFPGMLFTIGDNGTAWTLTQEVLNALKHFSLPPERTRIAVLGATGILGEMVIQTLLREGYFEVIGVGNHRGRLSQLARRYEIEIHDSLDIPGKVDAVVACTHHPRLRLTAQHIQKLRRPFRKLLVIDVAEPANLSPREYRKARPAVVRQDAGNLFYPGLRFVLNPLTTRIIHLHPGVIFGCFAEAFTLAHYFDKDIRVHQYDWFQVNEKQMQYIGLLMQSLGFFIPSPLCFGKPVNEFTLTLEKDNFVIPSTTRAPLMLSDWGKVSGN